MADTWSHDHMMITLANYYFINSPVNLGKGWGGEGEEVVTHHMQQLHAPAGTVHQVSSNWYSRSIVDFSV